MSTFSDEMAAVALDLIKEFGEAITVTKTAQGAYDPSTGTMGTGATTTVTGYGVPQNYTARDKDLESIEEGDVRLFINAVSTAPERGDTVTLDSVDYRVMEVTKYAINSSNVLYELQLRI